MQINARFEKVSHKEYAPYGDEKIYNAIKLPKRATKYSAGHDFYAPEKIVLEPKQTATVATGIKAIMPGGVFLALFPRSGLGFKYRLRLDNTVGIIDADYVNSPNEGHIFIRITNESDKHLEVAQGEAFAQGIFMPYLTTMDDDVNEERSGGLGSTSKKR